MPLPYDASINSLFTYTAKLKFAHANTKNGVEITPHRPKKEVEIVWFTARSSIFCQDCGTVSPEKYVLI